MDIQKKEELTRIELAPEGTVSAITTTIITDKGIEVARSSVGHSIVPGQDYSNEDARVQAICAATHTAEVIAAYKAAIAAQGV